MRVRINGKQYDLRFVKKVNADDDYGDCDPPDVKNKRIRIQKDLQGKIKLDTIIHELFHAALWDIKEETVEQSATDIAETLWKLGLRFDQDGE